LIDAAFGRIDSMQNPHKGRTGLTRVLFAAKNSAAGLAAAFRHESAFRQEIALSLLMLPAALWLGSGWVERSLLIGTVALVLIVELLNSGIEATVDRVSLDLHELSKRAKDYGSAAVLLALLLCGGVWAAALAAKLLP
jgi:diacylglycerol kinase (ATP)